MLTVIIRSVELRAPHDVNPDAITISDIAAKSNDADIFFIIFTYLGLVVFCFLTYQKRYFTPTIVSNCPKLFIS